MAGDFWTIHVWSAAPGRETELADAWERMAERRLSGGGGAALSLFAMSDAPREHYTPMRWESRAAYEAWRDGDGREGMDAVEAACDSVRVIPLDTVRVVRRG